MSQNLYEINLYKLINADKSDSDEIIKKKCNQKLAKYHPDKLINILKTLPEHEKEVHKQLFKEKYELFVLITNLLKNPEERKKYDDEYTKLKYDPQELITSFKNDICKQDKQIDETIKQQFLSHVNNKIDKLDNLSELVEDLELDREQQDLVVPSKLKIDETDIKEFNKQFNKLFEQKYTSNTSDKIIISKHDSDNKYLLITSE